jgi:nucleoside-diphosphate-sugar epimerase
MEQRLWDTSTWQADPALALATLGWRADTPLEVGMRATAAWLNDEVDP